ncbi:C4-type zinc ribbon domain-containing protein [Arthrobacter sp. zg-Y411]|uniref:zinc ribbon domain-containing protein n=1 Tax=Arthrobacter zhangbolii TaxID=2886936 RepID=UPI001D15C18F|nr:C4-type zinc ribbon domain-containing protein [Arthrobacter zhangbolii]
MAKASPAEQLRLLDLQALDSRIKALRNQARTISNNPEIASLADAVAAAESARVSAGTEVADVERELARADADVASVVARMTRDQQHLDSGKVGSKELTALQAEIVSLQRRRSDLEDVELEVMERLETARTRQSEAAAELETLHGQRRELEEKRDAELSVIGAEQADTEARREELASSFDPALLAAYEKTLSKHGIGAARLFHGTSEGSGMQLSPGDLADIRKAADDEIVYCPDSGCILVRSDEWGS